MQPLQEEPAILSEITSLSGNIKSITSGEVRTNSTSCFPWIRGWAGTSDASVSASHFTKLHVIPLLSHTEGSECLVELSDIWNLAIHEARSDTVPQWFCSPENDLQPAVTREGASHPCPRLLNIRPGFITMTIDSCTRDFSLWMWTSVCMCLSVCIYVFSFRNAKF